VLDDFLEDDEMQPRQPMTPTLGPHSAVRAGLCLLVLVLGLLLAVDAAAAGLAAQLDRNRVAEGETVVLTLTVPGDAAGAPDLSALAKDFDVLNQGQSTRMSIVNGRASSTHEWQLVLAPKRTGRLTVPALRLGGEATAPIALEVLPAAQAGKLGEAQPVLLEVEAEPERPYVQGQVIYRVRVLARVPLRQATLSDPAAGDAVVERLGEDRSYSVQRGGQQYQAIERRYAIFPQHSGDLTIDAPVLSAQIPEQGRRGRGLRGRMFGRDPFADMDNLFGGDPFANMGSLFEQTRPVQVRARALTLQVRPQPAAAVAPWLPAESLTLSETWSPEPPAFRVGEPVTRTIAVTAQGLTDAQLPDLTPLVPDDVKTYPDKAQGETRAEDDTLVAQKVVKTALVPTRPGTLTLPEVRLAWWDTKADTPMVSTLPAREVQVLPAPAGAPEPSSGPAPEVAAPAEPPPVSLPEGAQAGISAPVAQGESGTAVARLGEDLIRTTHLPVGYWPWLAGLLALAWLTSTALWLRARSAGPGSRPVPAPQARPVPSAAAALTRVRRACEAGDAKSARQALLDWAAARWPEDPPGRLETLARRLGGDAAEALRALDHRLYAGAAEPWDGPAAWRRLSANLPRHEVAAGATEQSSSLPPLYPQRA
jgi:hypothetical protein